MTNDSRARAFSPGRVMCLKCQGSGVDMDRATSRPGVLMPLCPGCRGSGAIDGADLGERYRAIFLVGTRFIVRITIARIKGGFVEMDVDWSPNLPPATGRGRLRPSEKRDYEAGRDAAMRQHNAQVGGGEFSLISSGDRQ